MCGITGWAAYDTDLTQHADVLAAMTDTLSQRGPDAAGTWLRPQVALGHRRLAVIDLDGGAQPMEADGVTLVYSGEVYNFTELREELGSQNFRTRSDTEVVLRGYLRWGAAVAERLNGMFAFALWDSREQKLVLVRDRLGVKPLYYQRTSDGLLFGSEPKSILANPLASRVIDRSCLQELFGQTKAPGWSLWKDMNEVPPGTVLTLTRSGLRSHRYWSLDTAEHTDDRHTTIETVRDLLTDTVARQLVADVPQCVLLSGGLDSSAITGLAAKAIPDLRTFSVDFTGEFTPDELRTTSDSGFVREVADFVGSKHTNVVLDPTALSDPSLRRAVVGAWDIPLGLGDINASLYLLFKAIRQESTVALSGESADELFGGYPWFQTKATHTFPWLTFSHSINTDRTAVLRKDLDLDLDSYVADQYASAVSEVEFLDNESASERQMRVICHLHLTRLVRALLDRKDRMSMATGLEVRVPFCDHRLVEYVYNAPWAFKHFDGREKSLLRAAARHVLPQSVADRVKSPYPSVQSDQYVTALQAQAADVLSEKDNPVFALIDRAWLRSAVSATSVSGPVRQGLERVLDLYHWVDLYRPTFAV
ncbi:asparagine synthase (glutamine-hydrolyzing) [Allokutzneria sp. NRRL B-24872]|uniref:asparagine synthase (glutamine-hydrolyzing) n=1 Tax=Allokutzneria sp. NRRL B-24872 TaxID=1137961 RepID=UPI000A3B24C6|nr:asparagine synthase (glutamine-hydrolyzing) [Allokutzneria sp. NRRL B-24872]